MSKPKSNFNAAIVINVSGTKAIAADPEFGRKLKEAIEGAMLGGEEDRIIHCSYKGQEVRVGLVIATHQADQCRVVATGNDTGVDLGQAGGVENLLPDNVRQLFEAATANFDLVVRQEAVRRTPEQKAADEKAEAEAKARRELERSQKEAERAAGAPSTPPAS